MVRTPGIYLFRPCGEFVLHILSLNINYYVSRHGDWPTRRELISDLIRSTAPDIIALQALRQDPNHYEGLGQAAQLASLIPAFKHSLFAPAVRAPDGSAEGSAVLSRLPLTSADIHPLTRLPNVDDPTHRVLIVARVDLADTAFYLANAHFSWLESQAALNLSETLPIVNSLDGPVLLVGDLNQPPDAAVMRTFAASGWTDAWASLCPGENGFTFENGLLDRRIDYGWANPKLADRLASIKVVGEASSRGQADISDHLGLSIRLDLRPG